MTGVRRRVTRELGTAARFAIVGGAATVVHVATAGFAFNNLVVGTLSVGLAAPGTASLTIAALVTPPVTYAINRLLIF